MKIRNFFLVATLAAVPAASMMAQTTYNQRHNINGRQDNQQARINQGVRSGQLTPHETQHLENQEGRINNEKHALRAADGGHLTAGDRHTLARQQNRESAKIYNDKHNLRTDPGVAPR